jgi:hypothetical protein
MTDAQSEYQRCLLQARRDSGVIWRMAIVSPFSKSELMLAVASGDGDAAVVFRQMERILRRLSKLHQPNKRAPLCLFCSAVLWRRHQPDAIVMISPDLSNSPHTACNLVCHDCCSSFADGAALNKAVMEYYRRTSPPGLREWCLHFPRAMHNLTYRWP